MVVGSLEGIGTDHPTTAGLRECVLQLVAAVGRVDVDEDHADLGACNLGDAPLGTIRCPYS
ncbi:hypothetical protein D3C73_1520390 [compost metagenome]